MLRLYAWAGVLVVGLGSAARACDGVVAVTPSAVVDNAVYVPLAVSVTPLAVVGPAAVQIDAFPSTLAPLQFRVSTAARARACVVPRVRSLVRPAHSRVTVRVR